MGPDALKIQAAITGDVGEAVEVFLPIYPNLDDQGLDSLFQPIATDARDVFRTALRRVLDHAIARALPVEQSTKLLMHVAYRVLIHFAAACLHKSRVHDRIPALDDYFARRIPISRQAMGTGLKVVSMRTTRIARQGPGVA